MDITVHDQPAARAAQWTARRLRDAVRRRGAAHLAVSGGSTAPGLFVALAALDVPWTEVTAWQVDERIAPDGDPARNAGQLDALPCRAVVMPVTDPDVRAAARRYGAGLPERFDVVHLGVGDDGHTASWPPGDPVIDAREPCVVVGPFHGHERMTLTPPVVDAARSRMVLATGAGKAGVIERWLLRDPTLPIDRVRRTSTWVFVDPPAAANVPGSALRRSG